MRRTTLRAAPSRARSRSSIRAASVLLPINGLPRRWGDSLYCFAIALRNFNAAVTLPMCDISTGRILTPNLSKLKRSSGSHTS